MPPAGFSFGRTGQGKEGKWVVLAVKDAPSGGNVLAQTDADKTDYRRSRRARSACGRRPIRSPRSTISRRLPDDARAPHRCARRARLQVDDTEETKSTGVVNRLIAETKNPQADVFWANDPVRPSRSSTAAWSSRTWRPTRLGSRRALAQDAPQDEQG
jgi:hypothetical protein